MPDESPGPARHVFVYGTLRAGGSNDIRFMRPAPAWVGPARLRGTMYDLGAYPGAVLAGEGELVGEVWRIGPALEAALDRLEGVRPDGSGEYLRRECDVAVHPDAVLRCLVYEIHPARIAGAPVVPGGDWLAHLRRAPAGGATPPAGPAAPDRPAADAGPGRAGCAPAGGRS